MQCHYTRCTLCPQEIVASIPWCFMAHAMSMVEPLNLQAISPQADIDDWCLEFYSIDEGLIVVKLPWKRGKVDLDSTSGPLHALASGQPINLKSTVLGSLGPSSKNFCCSCHRGWGGIGNACIEYMMMSRLMLIKARPLCEVRVGSLFVYF